MQFQILLQRRRVEKHRRSSEASMPTIVVSVDTRGPSQAGFGTNSSVHGEWGSFQKGGVALFQADRAFILAVFFLEGDLQPRLPHSTAY